MRLVTRYLLRQYAGPLFACLATFNGLFVLFDLFGHLSRFLDSGLPFVSVLRYYGGLLCMYSRWFLPASCMLATLYTMWRLSHHSELTAMRASGISFHRLTRPFFCTAVALSLGSFFVAERIAPDLCAWAEALKKNGFSEKRASVRTHFVYFHPASGRTWILPSADVSTEEGFAHIAPAAGEGFVQVKEEKDGAYVSGLRARRADWLDGLWHFTDPESISFGADGEEVPVDPAKKKGLPRTWDRPAYTETPRDMLLSVRNWEFLSLVDRLHILRGKDAPDPERWFDFWYAIASPWTCVVITLFAIPAGITTGRQSVFKGVALVLATFFAFYAVTLALEYVGQHGLLPPCLCAWLPNVAFLCVGLGLYRKLT